MKNISNLKLIKAVAVDGGKRTTYMLEGGPRSREEKIAQIDMEEAENLTLSITPHSDLAVVQSSAEVEAQNIMYKVEDTLNAVRAWVEGMGNGRMKEVGMEEQQKSEAAQYMDGEL